jgi:hypothetical protein
MSNIEIIGIWDGKNFITIINILATKNTELRVRQQGKKLIIKDTKQDFYRCIPVGCEVEIPKYESPIIEDDEPIQEEVRCECCNGVISEQQQQLLKEWGLWHE